MAAADASGVTKTWEELGDGDWQDVLRVAEAFFADGLQLVREYLQEAVRETLKRSDRVAVVDIGCGSGDLLRDVLKWSESEGVAERVRGIGVDVNAEIAREGERVTFVRADCINDDLKELLSPLLKPNEKVIATCMGNTLGIFSAEERQRVVSRMADVADSVILVLAAASAFQEGLDIFYPAVAGRLGLGERSEWEVSGTTLVTRNYHSHWSTTEEAKALLSSADLRCTQVIQSRRLFLVEGVRREDRKAMDG